MLLTVTVRLPNSLESLFRRGGDFDTGFELIAALQLQVGCRGAVSGCCTPAALAMHMLCVAAASWAAASVHGGWQRRYTQCEMEPNPLTCCTGHWPLQEGGSQEDAEDVLSMLQQLAESSAFGAVQATQGPCTSSVQHLPSGGSSSGGGGAEGAADPSGTAATAAAAAAGSADGAGGPGQLQVAYVFSARFQEQQQLEAFLNCPPVAALLQVGALLGAEPCPA